MKKSKLSLGLVTSFIGALALTSCNTTATVTASDKSIVDFIGYNNEDEKLEIDIDQFYSEYGDSDEGTTLFYNAVLEALIRYEYKGLSEEDKTLKDYDVLVKEAEDKVKAQKQTAQDNANSSGKTYAEEWQDILDSHNCDDEDDLKEYFLYELEKEAINDWYYTANQASLKDQYIGIDKNWNVVARPTDDDGNDTHEYESVFPYHILHILVKLSADATDYSRATISESEAQKLWNVVRKLMDGSYSFEEVAYSESEDSSNTAYGDVGIMSTQTSFYNEFKLGVYAYDALLSGVNAQDNYNKAIYSAFGIDNEAQVVTETKYDAVNGVVETKENVVDLVNREMVKRVANAYTGYVYDDTEETYGYTTIPTIPYDVFRQIGLSKDEEKIGTFEPEAGAVSYPRNILFNQFLNFRSPFIITAEDIKAVDGQDKVVHGEHNFATGESEVDATNNFKLANNNFEGSDIDNAIPNVGSKVLTDGEGNVIIGVRSTAGIHFMVMRKSVFAATNEKTVLGADTKKSVSLQDYYTTEIPSAIAENYPAQTYVNMTKSDDSSYYINRANTIKNKLKGQDSSDVFDAAYDYRIYQLLFDRVADKITFFDEDETTTSTVEANIKRKIQLLREGKYLSNIDTINNAWESYLAQLRHQNTIREYKGMLSTGCVFKWNAGDTAAFEKGAECYVK